MLQLKLEINYYRIHAWFTKTNYFEQKTENSVIVIMVEL